MDATNIAIVEDAMEKLPKKLYGTKDVIEVCGIPQSNLYSMIAAGEFPKPRKVGRTNKWTVKEIDRWIERLRCA